MLEVRYSRVKIVLFSVLLLGFAWGGLWVWSNFTGKGAFGGLMIAVVMLGLMPKMLRYFVDNTILRVRGSKIEFCGIFGTKTYRLEDLAGSQIETVDSGLASNRHLMLGDANWFTGARVAEGLLESRFRPIENLIDMIVDATQSAPPRSAQPATRQQPAPAEAPPVRTFGRKSV